MLSTRDCYEINNHWPLLETNISGHGDIQMDFKRFFFIFYATPGLIVESFFTSFNSIHLEFTSGTCDSWKKYLHHYYNVETWHTCGRWSRCSWSSRTGQRIQQRTENYSKMKNFHSKTFSSHLNEGCDAAVLGETVLVVPPPVSSRHGSTNCSWTEISSTKPCRQLLKLHLRKEL